MTFLGSSFHAAVIFDPEDVESTSFFPSFKKKRISMRLEGDHARDPVGGRRDGDGYLALACFMRLFLCTHAALPKARRRSHLHCCALSL